MNNLPKSCPYVIVAILGLLFCTQSNAMFLSKRLHPLSQHGKSSYHFTTKLPKKRILHEIISLNKKLLNGNIFLLQPNIKNPINNKLNNDILAKHGFPNIEEYNQKLPLYLHEYLDALIEIHDKFLHKDWHFGYLKNSYDGAFANIFKFEEITAHVELLMEKIIEHYPADPNEDWQQLLADFISLFKDRSCFKFHLRNPQREPFLQRFVFETVNRQPNIPLDASIKFHVRKNIPNGLGDPGSIKKLVSEVANITFSEEKN